MKFGKQGEFLSLLVQLNISTLQKRKPWRKKERYLLLENTLIFFFCYCKTTLVPLLINLAGRNFTNLQLLLPNFPYPCILNPLHTHTHTHPHPTNTHKLILSKISCCIWEILHYSFPSRLLNTSPYLNMNHILFLFISVVLEQYPEYGRF